MAANELGRARISMMVRSISSNTRPDTLVQDRTLQLTFSLATHGGSIHWVIRVGLIQRPRSRHVRFTSNCYRIYVGLRTDAKCQSRLNAPQQKSTAIRSPRRRGGAHGAQS